MGPYLKYLAHSHFVHTSLCPMRALRFQGIHSTDQVTSDKQISQDKSNGLLSFQFNNGHLILMPK